MPDMLMAKLHVVAFAAVVLSVGSCVQAASPDELVDWSELPYRPTVDRFLSAIEARDIGTAVETLGWPEDAAAKMTKPLADLVSIGPHDGHEVVAVRRISPRLHQVFGVIHYAQKPVLFVLHLRHFKEKWHIQAVNFGDDLKPLDDVASLERVIETKDNKVAADFH